MKIALTENKFIQEFESSSRKRSFTIGALEALYRYLTELEDEKGEETELDIVAVACDYCEYYDAEACILDIEGQLPDGIEADDEESLIEYLKEKTTVIEFEDGIIIQNY